MAKAETKDIAKLRAAYKQFLDDATFISPAEYWRRLVASWPNPDDDEAKAVTRKFLADIMQADPDNTFGKTRDELLCECQKLCDISDRRFRHVWDDVATPAYKLPGPRRKRRK